MLIFLEITSVDVASVTVGDEQNGHTQIVEL